MMCSQVCYPSFPIHKVQDQHLFNEPQWLYGCITCSLFILCEANGSKKKCIKLMNITKTFYINSLSENFELQSIPQSQKIIWDPYILILVLSNTSRPIILNILRIMMPIFSLQIAHRSFFKILQLNHILTSKIVHENSMTNIGWSALKTTLSWPCKLGSIHCMLCLRPWSALSCCVGWRALLWELDYVVVVHMHMACISGLILGILAPSLATRESVQYFLCRFDL